MDRETIIKFAREAGFDTGVAGIGVPPTRISTNDTTDAPWMLECMTHFANLVAEHECKEIADDLEHGFVDDEGHHIQYAAAIRARGEA